MKRVDLYDFIAGNNLLQTIPAIGGGIYAITVDDCIEYIGQSKDLRRRCMEHIYNIENAVLNQEKKYLLLLSAQLGGHKVDCHLLERCKDFELLDKENYYIEKYKPILNINTSSGRRDISNLKIEDVLYGEKYQFEECA